jgi:hypothetical protein
MHGDGRTLVFCGRAASKIDLDRLKHLSAAESWPCGSSAEEDLVHVMVENDPEAIEVVPAEAHADVLSDSIADRVGVAQALALHNLHRLGAWGPAIARSDDQIHPPTPFRAL